MPTPPTIALSRSNDNCTSQSCDRILDNTRDRTANRLTIAALTQTDHRLLSLDLLFQINAATIAPSSAIVVQMMRSYQKV